MTLMSLMTAVLATTGQGVQLDVATSPQPTALWVAQVPEEEIEADKKIDYTARRTRGKFSFEFSKAEIVDIVKAISDMTRRNFIIPEKIKSQRLTILSPTKISSGEAYQVFMAALAANGITIVRVGRFYKLVESKDAIRDTIPTCIGGEEECPEGSDQMVTVLLPLRHVDANQINPVLKSLISKEGELTLFQPTNSLIISEYARNLARIKRIIEALDQPGGEDELQIVQIMHATASEIADKLSQIFEVQRAGTAQPSRAAQRAKAKKGAAGQAGDDAEPEVKISKIIPDDRTNQLIIKANQRSFVAIRKLIEKLDIPISDGDGIQVYYLENASAEELASTLSSLAQSQQQRAGSTARRPNQPAGQKAPDNAVLFQGEVQITADKSTNSLIIVASAQDYRALRRLIEKLDMPRRQVYVEAAILEVNVTNNDEFSLNWHAPIQFSKADLGDQLGGPGTVGFAQSAQSGSVSPTLVPLTDPSALLSIAGGSVAGVVGKGLDIPLGDGNTLTVPSFGVVLRWLQSVSTANIISTPHILTTDNEEASIEVGQRIPFQRGTSIPNLGGLGNVGNVGSNVNSAAALGSLNSLFSATDRIDVSLKLTITPQVNERDKIRLEIDQQIEDLVGREERTQQPITANRNAKTVVVVDDQQTVVIGGLMRDRVRESESKIPILGDIPLIGWLFKQRSTEVEKLNLLLVLTPYIIKEARDFQEIFERKLQEHEEFAAIYYADRPEYRAHINFRRKSGPFARLAQSVEREMVKVENGGPGTGELLIAPPSSPVHDDEPIRVPMESGGLGGDDGDDGGSYGDDGSTDSPVPEDAGSPGALVPDTPAGDSGDEE